MSTVNFSFELPQVGADDGIWGDALNQNFVDIDEILYDFSQGIGLSNIPEAALVPSARVPVGTALWFAGATPPVGYLVCNGAEVSRTAYAALFAVIGTLHGAGNGTTTFNLPDGRARYARGSNPVLPVGLTQSSTVQAHTHAAGTLATSTAGGHNHGGQTGAAGAHSHGSGIFRTGSAFTVTTIGGAFHASGSTDTAPNHTHFIGTDGAHTHTITGATASTGDGETRPETIVYLPIIKF